MSAQHFLPLSLSLLAASCYVSQRGRASAAPFREKTPQSSRSEQPLGGFIGGLCVESGARGFRSKASCWCHRLIDSEESSENQHAASFLGVIAQSCARRGGPALCRPRNKTWWAYNSHVSHTDKHSLTRSEGCRAGLIQTGKQTNRCQNHLRCPCVRVRACACETTYLSPPHILADLSFFCHDKSNSPMPVWWIRGATPRRERT